MGSMQAMASPAQGSRLHVAAADALAAAISAGEGSSRKQPKALGTAIAPGQELLEVGGNALGQNALKVRSSTCPYMLPCDQVPAKH